MSEELEYIAQEMYEPEKEERMNEDTSLEAYQAAINEVNERFGYRIEARIAPVPNSNFVQAELIAVKING